MSDLLSEMYCSRLINFLKKNSKEHSEVEISLNSLQIQLPRGPLDIESLGILVNLKLQDLVKRLENLGYSETEIRRSLMDSTFIETPMGLSLSIQLQPSLKRLI